MTRRQPMSAHEPSALAAALRPVLARLVRRLRRERTFPLSHGTVLVAVEREPGLSVSDLAGREQVRPQSMAQTVSELEDQGFIRREPDPHDGRRAIVTLTAGGAEVLAAERGRRQSWLAAALEETLTPQEREELSRAIPLLERLAECEAPRRTRD
jgi:DNA-binding MarR family transcriptional regulator